MVDKEGKGEDSNNSLDLPILMEKGRVYMYLLMQYGEKMPSLGKWKGKVVLFMVGGHYTCRIGDKETGVLVVPTEMVVRTGQYSPWFALGGRLSCQWSMITLVTLF